MNKVNIIALYKNNGVGYHRVLKPMLRLETLYGHAFKVWLIDVGADKKTWKFPEPQDGNVNIIFFNTVLGLPEDSPVLNYLEVCVLEGAKLVLDIDDYFGLGRSVAVSDAQKKLHYEGVKEAIRAADYVTTTTEMFKGILYEINKNVFVLPNFADSMDPQYDYKETSLFNDNGDRIIRFGVTGAAYHKYDMSILQNIPYLLKKSGHIGRIRFVLCGYHDNIAYHDYEDVLTSGYRTVSRSYRHILEDRSINDIEMKGEPYERVQWMSHDKYITAYDKFDVLLAPLEDSVFNTAKSPIKYVEAGYKKRLFIGSDVPCYNMHVKNNKTGFLCKNKDQFLKTIQMVVDEWDQTNGFYSIKKNAYNDVVDNYEAVNVTEKRAELFIKIATTEV